MAGSLSTLGIGSGLDLQDIIDQLKAADSVSIKRKETTQLTYKDKIEKFDSLQAKLLKAKEDILDLSLQSTYMERTSSLSSASVLSADTLDGVETGSHHLKVNSLASKSSWKSAVGVASSDAYINDTGSDQIFTYEVNGESTSLTVPSGTSILSFASMINSDSGNPGVTASVIQDGSGADSYKLLMKSDNTGEQGRISITTQLGGHDLSEETGNGTTLDAEIEIEGVAYKRSSNTIDDVLNGVTFNLFATGETTLKIETDKTAIKEQVESFVTNLKEVLKEINDNSDYDTESSAHGAFYDVSSIRLFKSQLVNDIISPLDIDGSITSMVDLGLEYTRDGELNFDEEVFEKALDGNFEDVKKFLLGDTEENVTGFADTINERLRSATSAANGIIYLEKNSAQTMYDKLGAQIESDQERLDKRYEIMTKQFLELDKYMSQMNNMSSYLSQQIDALNSAND